MYLPNQARRPRDEEEHLLEPAVRRQAAHALTLTSTPSLISTLTLTLDLTSLLTLTPTPTQA